MAIIFPINPLSKFTIKKQILSKVQIQKLEKAKKHKLSISNFQGKGQKCENQNLGNEETEMGVKRAVKEKERK